MSCADQGLGVLLPQGQASTPASTFWAEKINVSQPWKHFFECKICIFELFSCFQHSSEINFDFSWSPWRLVLLFQGTDVHIWSHRREVFWKGGSYRGFQLESSHFTKATKEKTIPNKNDFVRAPPKTKNLFETHKSHKSKKKPKYQKHLTYTLCIDTYISQWKTPLIAWKPHIFAGSDLKRESSGERWIGESGGAQHFRVTWWRHGVDVIPIGTAAWGAKRGWCGIYTWIFQVCKVFLVPFQQKNT